MTKENKLHFEAYYEGPQETALQVALQEKGAERVTSVPSYTPWQIDHRREQPKGFKVGGDCSVKSKQYIQDELLHWNPFFGFWRAAEKRPLQPGEVRVEPAERFAFRTNPKTRI